MKRTRRVEVIRYTRRTNVESGLAANDVDDMLAIAVDAFKPEETTIVSEPIVIQEKGLG